MEIVSLYDRGYVINYKEGDQSFHRTPLLYFPSVYDKWHTIREDETLYDISRNYLGSSRLWYLIADANPEVIIDIFDLTVGDVIVIPNISIIKSPYAA